MGDSRHWSESSCRWWLWSPRSPYASFASATDWRCWHGTSLSRKISRWGERRWWRRAATARQHTGRYRQPGTDKLNTMSAVESAVVADSWADALVTIHLHCPRNDNQQTTRESIMDNCKIELNKEGMQHTEMQENTNTTMNKILFQSARNVATNKMPIVIYGFLFFCECNLQLQDLSKHEHNGLHELYIICRSYDC
jgi:hypothetical protein